MTREILYRSFDARQTQNILAAPSGGRPDAVTVRSEIDELVSDLLSKITQLRTETQQADTTDTTNWNQAISQVNQRLTDALDGVRNKYAVAASVGSLAELSPDLPGLETTSPDWYSWVLVRGTSLSENGIYRYQGGNWVRVPKFSTIDAFQTGTTFFDNSSNVGYVVGSDAVPANQGSTAIGTVEIIPYSRAEQISGSGFISVIANQINAALDGNYLAVTNGNLTLASSVTDQIETLVDQDVEQAAAIDSINTTLAGINSQIAQFNVTITTATETLATQTSQITALQQADAQILPRIQATETAIASITPQLLSLEQTNAAQQQQINQQTQLLTNAQQQISQHETSLAGHTQQLATHQQQLTGLDASVTDARATILAHTSELTTLSTELATKLDSSELETLQEQKLQSLVKRFPLIGGIRQLRIDPDDNREYHFTTFEISTGWGHLNFRSFDMSEALAPYTKMGFEFMFQRVGLDKFRITSQSRLEFFPDGLADVSLIRIPQAGPQRLLLITPDIISISGNTPFNSSVYGFAPSSQVGIAWVKDGTVIQESWNTITMPADGTPFRADATGGALGSVSFISPGFYALMAQVTIDGQTQFFGSNVIEIKA